MAIAYFSTWTMYGTWLPGDPRGWFEAGSGFRLPNELRKYEAALRMQETSILFEENQRKLVEHTIADHCRIRNWQLHAVNCGTNHVHVLVTAPGRKIEIQREQFKSWCTRKLKDDELARFGRSHIRRESWWGERGWDVYVDDEESLSRVIAYILEGQ